MFRLIKDFNGGGEQMKEEKIIKFLFIGIFISWFLYFIFYMQAILLIIKQNNDIDFLETQLIQEQIQNNHYTI